MRYRALVVALVVILAGCSAFGGQQETPTPTVTPADVPTDTRDSLAAQPLPPDGLSNETILDVNELASGHREALTNRSYTLVERREIVVRNETDTLRRTVVLERTWVSNGSAFRHDINRRVHSLVDNTTSRYNRTRYATSDSWWTGDGENIQRRDGDSPLDTDHYTRLSGQAVTRFLSLQNATVTRRGEALDSEYRIDGTGLNYPDPTFAFNYTGRAVVEQSGLVRDLRATYTETIEGNFHQTTYQFEVRNVGSTTVPPPKWVEN